MKRDERVDEIINRADSAIVALRKIKKDALKGKVRMELFEELTELFASLRHNVEMRNAES